MHDIEDALLEAHNQGQRDAANGEYNPPYDSSWELSNMVSFGLRSTYEGVSLEERELINEAYKAGWNHAHDQQ